MKQAAIGSLIRTWRQRRHLSQLDLASDANISTKHLSFLETGRSQPSRDMLLHLAEHLEVPLREQNVLLVTAGYAPLFSERSLDDDDLDPAREAIQHVLHGHEPYPAIAINRHWQMVMANNCIDYFLAGVATELLTPPVNVLRLSLHPEGLAPQIVNLAAWKAHLLARLRHQIELTADPSLSELYQELAAYPTNQAHSTPIPAYHETMDIALPFALRTSHGVLSFFSTTMVFGTPIDVTVSELAIEAFFPANAATAELLRQVHAAKISQ